MDFVLRFFILNLFYFFYLWKTHSVEKADLKLRDSPASISFLFSEHKPLIIYSKSYR